VREDNVDTLFLSRGAQTSQHETMCRFGRSSNSGRTMTDKLTRKQAQRRARYEANRERVISQASAWQKANPEKHRKNVAAHKARRKAAALLEREGD
jgi:hypothetical protein